MANEYLNDQIKCRARRRPSLNFTTQGKTESSAAGSIAVKRSEKTIFFDLKRCFRRKNKLKRY
jgi:hypothetical protein